MSTTYEERTWRFGKTDDLPDGPWKTEPDKVQWVDKATGFDCLIVRNASLCGYVGVPPEHPWHGKGYSECVAPVCLNKEEFDCWTHSVNSRIDVHGGLTFADSCNESQPDHICHVPYASRPGNVWWFGFDCAHGGDLIPRHLGYDVPRFGDESYKDIAYVKAEVASLARQLAEVSR